MAGRSRAGRVRPAIMVQISAAGSCGAYPGLLTHSPFAAQCLHSAGSFGFGGAIVARSAVVGAGGGGGLGGASVDQDSPRGIRTAWPLTLTLLYSFASSSEAITVKHQAIILAHCVGWGARVCIKAP